MNASILLSRLSGVRQTGPSRWSAACPAHEDQAPSLSIRETDAGKVLVHCFTGCDTESVLAAIGLTWRDLYPDRWHEAEARTLAQGHKRQRTLADISLADYAKNVLRIAEADRKAGKSHDVWDRAAIALAQDIMGGCHHG